MMRRLVIALVDVALIIGIAIAGAPILYVGLHPVFARPPAPGKFTMRAGPIVEVRR